MHLFSNARRTWMPASTLLGFGLLSACSSSTLDVTNPDVIGVPNVASPIGAVAQRNGAIQDFTVVYSGTQDGFIVSTGNMGDEILATDTFFDRLLPNERNTTNNLPGLDTWYLNMHKARAGATRAIKVWSELKPASKDTLGELYAIRGMVQDFFGEAYCNGVPFSEEDGTTATYGMPLTNAQIFNIAVASFDSAATNATSAQNKNLAAVGKARALLNLGQFAQAAAAVAGVPTSFKYLTYHSNASTRQYNGVWNATVTASSRYTVANNEGGNGYNYLQTPPDPRMPWVPSTRIGFDGTTLNLPTQQKYPTQGQPSGSR